jgi:drug/metabolite transporter (DMT)-like permease
MIYIATLINVCLLVTGQILFKWGLEAVGGFSVAKIFSIVFQPWIILGLMLYVVATVVWFYVLSKANLSLAYPLQSISYVIGLFASRFILHESIPATRWMGVLVIMLGVALVAYQPKVHA